ncbi:DNA repair protein RecN [Thermoleophilia bacterium SCSIO 60948]|nr:DNA repair protein RecN [Thermoleophilia bacterium SCSIO 60948]
MLLELRIENLLLIERAELRFGAGLNAITGETGAGKTILAHSLDLLLGGRARAQIVRPGASEAWVEGVFELPEGLLDDPELADIAERLPEAATEVVLGRRVGASGRTSAFIAGRSAPAADLTALGSRLISFYGQHEHRRLMLGSAQLGILDGFAGSAQVERRERYAEAHRRFGAAQRELAELREREGARERDLDLLRFELEEIDAAAPDPEGAAAAAVERERLRHSEALRGAAGGASVAITGDEDPDSGALAPLADAESGLAALDGVDPDLDALAERMRAATLELTELSTELRAFADGVDSEPGRLEEVEEQLATLDRLKRKHGGSIEAVLEHAERCRARIAELEGSGERAEELEAELGELGLARERLAAELSAERRTAAARLESEVEAALGELAMEGARLEVALDPVPESEGGFTATGAESVEFRVATNPGMPVSSLRDAASGGELSRIMLALCGAERGERRTLVFDEVDAGIGGNTARVVGERLRALADAGQVICITHLPQVASLAARHFRIAKSRDGDSARTDVELVEGEALVGEIVRMMGGETSDQGATQHARELLEAA